MSLKMITVIKFELLKNFKKISFWLLPISFSVIMLISTLAPVFFANLDSDKNSSSSEIVVLDTNKILPDLLQKEKQEFEFVTLNQDLENLKESLKKSEISTILVIEDFYEMEVYYNTNSTVDFDKLTIFLNQEFLNSQIQEGQIIIQESQQDSSLQILKNIPSQRFKIEKDTRDIISGVSTFIKLVQKPKTFLDFRVN
jgi:hypothetical protein